MVLLLAQRGLWSGLEERMGKARIQGRGPAQGATKAGQLRPTCLLEWGQVIGLDCHANRDEHELGQCSTCPALHTGVLRAMHACAAVSRGSRGFINAATVCFLSRHGPG